MAYSETQWKEAKYLFEIENKGPTEIQEATGISKAQISKTAKRDGWEKETDKTRIKAEIAKFEKNEETIRKQKETIISTVSKLDDYEITILRDTLDVTEDIKRIIFNTTLLGVVRNNEILTRNKKQTIVKIKQYANGKVIGEVPDFIDTDLEPRDVKDIIEGNDKAAITMGIADRHAPKGDVNVQTNLQNNFTKMEVEIIDVED